MVVVPATFEEVQEFIIEQEQIITKSIKNDSTLQKMIRKSGIEISNEELDKILRKINKQMKRKYRMGWFTRQSRFQVSQQVIQLERENRKDKMEKIGDVSNVLRLFDYEGDVEGGDVEGGDVEGGDVEGEDVEEDSALDEKILELIGELPDSNLLGTNDVELIEQYDDIREKLLATIGRRRRLERSISNLRTVNEKLDRIVKRRGTQTADTTTSGELAKEIERMQYLLALSEVKK